MSDKIIKVGLVGAGYIADWHGDAIKATKGVDVVAVCDVSQAAAEALGQAYGARSFTSLDDMIAAQVCDAVHILTPPQTHKDIAITCINAGLHTFVEKPIALSYKDTKEITLAGKKSNRCVGVGHNFLGLPSYVRMKSAYETGKLGRIASAEFNWNFPLAPLRSGPFGLWMLRDPKNLLLELGPHLFAYAIDLFGPLEILHLELGKTIALSGGGERPQSWRILARAGDVDLAINLSLVETMDDRSVTLYGSSGIARLNFAADTLVTTADNTADIVLNPFLFQMSHAWQHMREATLNATKHLMSLNRRSAYGVSFANTVASFYDAVKSGDSVDGRFSGQAAECVMQAIEDTILRMPNKGVAVKRKPVKTKPCKPMVLVIGGTGFIGRNLTRTLVAKGHDVRVLSRGTSAPFDDLHGRVETFSASLKDPQGLRDAMKGINAVYHLAKSVDTTWEGCLQNDVAVTKAIAQAALDEGVKRFIYTGTIASYDMSEPTLTITEKTGFDADMTDRNLYARSKAACEMALMDMYRNDELPLVIARPGIVVGNGGPLQHWGIGRWQGAGAVKIWGQGRNILPFVLIDDVSDGLIRMMDVDKAIGQSFNLVGEPMMTARDYFDAIHKTLGARICVRSGWMHGLFVADGIKYGLKRYILRRRGVIRASLRDWKSRGHYAPFQIDYPKQVLGWEPEKNRDVFVKKAITKANLFGF